MSKRNDLETLIYKHLNAGQTAEAEECFFKLQDMSSVNNEQHVEQLKSILNYVKTEGSVLSYKNLLLSKESWVLVAKKISPDMKQLSEDSDLIELNDNSLSLIVEAEKILDAESSYDNFMNGEASKFIDKVINVLKSAFDTNNHDEQLQAVKVIKSIIEMKTKTDESLERTKPVGRMLHLRSDWRHIL